MADKIVLSTNVGTGDSVAADDLGAFGKAQWVKLMDGTDGGTDVIPGTAASGLRVDPAAVSVADGGTLPAKGVQVGGTDGSVFQVLSTDSAGRLNTNVNGTVPVSGPLTDTQLRATPVPVSGTVTANAGTGPFPVSDNAGSLTVDATAASFAVNSAQVSGTAISVNSGTKDAGTQRVTLATDQVQLTNALKVDPSAVTSPVSIATAPVLVAGTALIGRVQIDSATANGATPATYVSAASTNATSVKASAGQLYGVIVSNVNAAARYLKVFNKASAPTVGTDTPVLNILIPGNAAGAGSNIPIPSVGVAFGTGIAFAITTGVALLDTGAVAASEITVNLLYK